MMHYRKGENVEQKLTKEDLPFNDFLPKDADFLWMHVNGGTKVNNVITYAKTALEKGEHKSIVWSGSGGGVVKTVSCAEILKRSFPLYQLTRMCYTTIEEHWKPQTEGLDELVANRQIPSLHIYMSLEPIDDSVDGVQKPNTKTDFWIYDDISPNPKGSGTSKRQNPRNPRQRGGPQQRQRQPPKEPQPSTSNNNTEDGEIKSIRPQQRPRYIPKQPQASSSNNNTEDDTQNRQQSSEANAASNAQNHFKRKRQHRNRNQNQKTAEVKSTDATGKADSTDTTATAMES